MLYRKRTRAVRRSARHRCPPEQQQHVVASGGGRWRRVRRGRRTAAAAAGRPGLAVGRHQPNDRPAEGRGDGDRRPDRRHARRLRPSQRSKLHSGRARRVRGGRGRGHRLARRGHQEPAARALFPGFRARSPVRLQRSALLQHGGWCSSLPTTSLYSTNVC